MRLPGRGRVERLSKPVIRGSLGRECTPKTGGAAGFFKGSGHSGPLSWAIKPGLLVATIGLALFSSFIVGESSGS
jgi:hypothetical protein